VPTIIDKDQLHVRISHIIIGRILSMLLLLVPPQIPYSVYHDYTIIQTNCAN